MDQIRKDEGGSSAKIEEVKRELNRQLEAEDRRMKFAKLAGLTVLGFALASIFGQSPLLGAALGLALGSALNFSGRQKIKS